MPAGLLPDCLLPLFYLHQAVEIDWNTQEHQSRDEVSRQTFFQKEMKVLWAPLSLRLTAKNYSLPPKSNPQPPTPSLDCRIGIWAFMLIIRLLPLVDVCTSDKLSTTVKALTYCSLRVAGA